LIEAHAETLDKAAADALLAAMDKLLAVDDYAGLKKLIEDNKINVPSVKLPIGPMYVSSINVLYRIWWQQLLKPKETILFTCVPKLHREFCKLFECTKNRQDENSFWYCTNRLRHSGMK